MQIPFVGNFIVRGNIAAIAFNNDINKETKGVTAKAHTLNNMFNSVSKQNLQMLDTSK